MTDERLIEEAAAKRYPHRNVFLEGMAYMSEERSRIPLREAFVEGAKWQAEKVHTPTDDEREMLLRDLYTLRGWIGGDVVRRIEIIDRALAALSRSEVPEPSARDLLDAIYDPEEDRENDSVRFGYVVEQYERLSGGRS